MILRSKKNEKKIFIVDVYFSFFVLASQMNEFKCKACLTDSTHGKLQKKKEVLLEFTFADASLCLTVSAQNLNLTTYTLNKDSISSILPTNDLLVINFKMKSQIKISAMDKTKMIEFKSILESLLRDERDGKNKNKSKRRHFSFSFF